MSPLLSLYLYGSAQHLIKHSVISASHFIILISTLLHLRLSPSTSGEERCRSSSVRPQWYKHWKNFWFSFVSSLANHNHICFLYPILIMWVSTLQWKCFSLVRQLLGLLFLKSEVSLCFRKIGTRNPFICMLNCCSMQRSGFQDPFFFIHYLILLLCLMTMDAPPTGTDKQYYHVFKSFSHLGWQSSVWSWRLKQGSTYQQSTTYWIYLLND